MIAKEIRELRKQLGLSQKELATRVKVDAITIRRWEGNEHRPSALAGRQLNRLMKKNNIATE